MLADQVRQARECAGLSTYALAKHSGIGVATIADIESGRNTNPGIVTMTKLANVLNVSLDDLAERPRPRRPRPAQPVG
jgi:transcriptional regulator with XRE-family HTH domain